MNNRITIVFQTREAANAFCKAYSGDWKSYHPNYKGGSSEIVWDRYLFSSLPIFIYLNRDKVVSFSRLAQDVKCFGGTIQI
ncbi:MAG: hypothetical protein UH853_06200 [Muribaculaceae bacterium]|nr:hypothetical protein [Muribaculaceae bacterium]